MVLSLNANTVLFIMFFAYNTTVWQQRQLGAPRGDITSPFLSQPVTADPHRKKFMGSKSSPSASSSLAQASGVG